MDARSQSSDTAYPKAHYRCDRTSPPRFSPPSALPKSSGWTDSRCACSSTISPPVARSPQPRRAETFRGASSRAVGNAWSERNRRELWSCGTQAALARRGSDHPVWRPGSRLFEWSSSAACPARVSRTTDVLAASVHFGAQQDFPLRVDLRLREIPGRRRCRSQRSSECPHPCALLQPPSR